MSEEIKPTEIAETELINTVRSQPNMELMEAYLMCVPQNGYHMKHSFAPGVYLREITMLAGTTLIGRQHKYEHFNMVLSGRCSVVMEGEVHQIIAPCYFKSGPGVQKVLHIHEDTVWVTIHPNPTGETDPDKIKEDITVQSPTEQFLKDKMVEHNMLERLEQCQPKTQEINL